MTAPRAVASTLPPPPAVTPTAVSRSFIGDFRLAAPVALALGLAAWQPTDDGVTLCPWRNCTGGACPGCGLTRGAAAFVRGDWATSWYYHPAAVFVIVQVAAIWSLAVGRRVGVVDWQPSRRLVSAFIVVNGLALMALWLVRWRLGHLGRVT